MGEAPGRVGGIIGGTMVGQMYGSQLKRVLAGALLLVVLASSMLILENLEWSDSDDIIMGDIKFADKLEFTEEELGGDVVAIKVLVWLCSCLMIFSITLRWLFNEL